MAGRENRPGGVLNVEAGAGAILVLHRETLEGWLQADFKRAVQYSLQNVKVSDAEGQQRKPR